MLWVDSCGIWINAHGIALSRWFPGMFQERALCNHVRGCCTKMLYPVYQCIYIPGQLDLWLNFSYLMICAV